MGIPSCHNFFVLYIYLFSLAPKNVYAGTDRHPPYIYLRFASLLDVGTEPGPAAGQATVITAWSLTLSLPPSTTMAEMGHETSKRQEEFKQQRKSKKIKKNHEQISKHRTNSSSYHILSHPDSWWSVWPNGRQIGI